MPALEFRLTDSQANEMAPEIMLTVVIPAFNEIATIDKILSAVREVPVEKEIIVVDDCSTDGTREQLSALAESDGFLRVFYHDINQGKGAALRTGFAQAQGRFVIVQDADLEYDPAEYPQLLQPLLTGRADAVFGSRFTHNGRKRKRPTWHMLGNSFLTWLSNLFTNLNLSDMETCFKAFRREIIQDIRLVENGFGIEPEITAKLAAYRCQGTPLRIQEVGISYRGRSYQEGKKIGWRDGLHAMWCIVRYNCFR